MKGLSFISILLLFTAFSLIHQIAKAQNLVTSIFKESKQFVGMQYNPYFYYLHHLWEPNNIQNDKTKVYALRYGIEAAKNLYGGVDVSGMWYKNEIGSHGYEFKPGIFGRYSFFGEKQVQILIEPSIYYQFGKYHYPFFEDSDLSRNKFGWYASAGMGINLYKKKVTLDLMVKYSPDVMFEGYHFVPTYKLNYHFN